MKVYLISAPALHYAAVAQFLEDEGDLEWHGDPIGESSADALCEFAGRVCYMAFGAAQGRKTNRQYLANITARRHFSVLEHANYGFLFTGVSRSLTHELVRHRHFSISQLSQRYVDESEAAMVVPAVLKEPGLGMARDEWEQAVGAAKERYGGLMHHLEAWIATNRPELAGTERRKLARQTARSVLPNATETKIVVTGNLRTWREFIEKRASPHADPEIRALAEEVRAVLCEYAPNALQNLAP